MRENKECPQPGQFSWNELVAIDSTKAKDFYTRLFGWTTQAFGDAGNYTIFKKGDQMVGGMVNCPKPGLPAHWLAYVTVEDVDAIAAQTVKLGGKVVMEPMNVPTVGRIAVLLDPQGAAIGVFKPGV